MNDMTQEYVRECFDYSPDTGDLMWKKRPRHHFSTSRGMNIANTSRAGTIVSSVVKPNGKRYIQIRLRDTNLSKKYYLAHRLIWLYVHGAFPPDEIDHADGDGTNNKLSNLRIVDRVGNSRNHRRQSNNTSGVTGVWWSNINNKWIAEIIDKGKKIRIGCFADLEQAATARKVAELIYDFHPNHGQVRPL